MRTYQDNATLAIDDTLLLYTGRDAFYQVPEQLDCQSIHKIGKGAFAARETLQGVTLGKHITHIGQEAFALCKELRWVQMDASVTTVEKDAFTNCPKLEEMHLTSLSFTTAEWEGFQASCMPGPGGAMVTPVAPPLPLVRQVVDSMDQKPARLLPPMTPVLLRGTPYDVRKADLRSPQQVVGFGGSADQIVEEQFAVAMMDDELAPWRSAEAEQNNDSLVRRSIDRSVESCLLFTATQRRKPRGGRIVADLHIWVGCFCWPSITRVVCDGEEYFIYHRIHVSSEPKLGYLRRDMALMNRRGIIEDEAVARRVYAKYMLPIIL